MMGTDSWGSYDSPAYRVIACMRDDSETVNLIIDDHRRVLRTFETFEKPQEQAEYSAMDDDCHYDGLDGSR